MSLEVIQKQYTELLQAQADAKYWYKLYEDQVNAEQQQQIDLINSEHEQVVREAEAKFTSVKSNAVQRAKDVLERAGIIAADWTESSWESFLTGQKPLQTPQGVRIGSLAKSFPNLGITSVPFVIPFLNVGHILIISQGAAKVAARQLLQNITTRLLLTVPAESARFTFIDPIGVGANFPFSAVPKSIRGESILSEQDEIASSLRAHTDVIRKSNMGENDNIIRFFCVADFPTRFDTDMLTRIATIAEQGIKAGVYLIIHVDSSVALPESFDPSPLLNASTIIYAEPESFRANVDGTEYTFQPDSLPNKPLLQSLLSNLGSK